MIKMAFPQNVIQVILQCVTTVSYSLMLNGQQAGSFCPQRGIHQDPQNCSSVKQVLDKYAGLTAQVLNKDKSIAIFSPNTPRQFKRMMASTLGAKTSNKLGRYLGVKVDNRVNSADLFKEMLSVLPMPNKYANRIDALSTNFYWGQSNNKSSIHLASKQKLFKSKDKGGMGLRQTSLFNKALMAKQVWRIVSQPASVYSQSQ
ncbi:reverse transcriptase [Senna tora]|uniref:Reverse transcriptase n=1 Tax=Senna tora TaxID=362788 RepID=A0A834WIQ5_9FABA|nr:reverse transcriptase [Senna tora]